MAPLHSPSHPSPGREGVSLSIPPGGSQETYKMKKYIGCDLGGTNLRAAIVDVETGAVLHHSSIQTLAREGHESVMKRMADLCLQVIQAAGMDREDIGGI